jgi:hypothetical protein
LSDGSGTDGAESAADVGSEVEPEETTGSEGISEERIAPDDPEVGPASHTPLHKRTGVIVTALVVVILAIVGIAIGAKASGGQGETLTLTVDPASWAKAQAYMEAPGTATPYTSTANFIWSFLCEDGDPNTPWFAPTPTETGQDPTGVTFSVHLTAAEVSKGNQELKSQDCASQDGVQTIQQDYNWAATPSEIASTIAVMSQPSPSASTSTPTTQPAPTTTTAPPPTPQQIQSGIVSAYKAATQPVTIAQLANVPSQYKGKHLTVSGTIYNFLQDAKGNTTALNLFDGTSSDIQVLFSKTLAPAQMNKGDTIVVWGTGTGTIVTTNALGGVINESTVQEVYLYDSTTGYTDYVSTAP